MHPTDLARTNLEVLRGTWSELLAGLLDDVDPSAIARCNETLARLEQRFAGDDGEAGLTPSPASPHGTGTRSS